MQHRVKIEYIRTGGHVPISGITDNRRYQRKAGKRNEYCGRVETNMEKHMGGDLGGTRGRSPQNLKWGDGPRILRSTAIGYEENYELTKKDVKEEFFVVKSRFLIKKRVIIICYYIRISDSRHRQTK